MTGRSPLRRSRNATRSFRRGDATIDALGGVDLAIEHGEIVALVGPSGSGKTTLLQLLGALDRPTSGQIFFEGRDLNTLGDNELAGPPTCVRSASSSRRSISFRR